MKQGIKLLTALPLAPLAALHAIEHPRPSRTFLPRRKLWRRRQEFGWPWQDVYPRVSAHATDDGQGATPLSVTPSLKNKRHPGDSTGRQRPNPVTTSSSAAATASHRQAGWSA